MQTEINCQAQIAVNRGPSRSPTRPRPAGTRARRLPERGAQAPLPAAAGARDRPFAVADTGAGEPRSVVQRLVEDGETIADRGGRGHRLVLTPAPAEQAAGPDQDGAGSGHGDSAVAAAKRIGLRQHLNPLRGKAYTMRLHESCPTNSGVPSRDAETRPPPPSAELDVLHAASSGPATRARSTAVPAIPLGTRCVERLLQQTSDRREAPSACDEGEPGEAVSRSRIHGEYPVRRTRGSHPAPRLHCRASR